MTMKTYATTPAADALKRALQTQEQDLRDIIDAIRVLDDDALPGLDLGVTVEQMRLSAELVGCLRRLIDECSVGQIHRAFGAPGDFGETPIGEALARLYREIAVGGGQ